jgi:hypothetical protein
MTLSSGHVMALAAIESHERLYLFDDGTGYRAGWEPVGLSFEAALINDLERWGLVRKSAVHVRGSKQSAVITEAGRARLLGGPKAGAA